MVYNLGGVVQSQEREKGPDHIGGIYYVRVTVRMFAPYCSIAAMCPKRRQGWRLTATAFDYRSAQTPKAILPRGCMLGPRFEESFFGDLARIIPSDADLPCPLHIRARVDWWPDRFAASRLGGGDVYQMISLRPPDGECSWFEIDYDDTVSDEADRQRFALAFTHPPAVPARPNKTDVPPPPQTDSNKADTPPPSQTQESSSWSSVVESDRWSQSNDWWNGYGHANDW